MSKQVLQLTDFAGGLNAYSDARDIQDNEFVQNWNAAVDKDGIIRVSGMATDTGGILTDYHTSENFQKGHGLFQFSADYSLSGISSDFATGLTTGTLDAIGTNTDEVFTLEDKNSTSSTDDAYNGLIMFIYSGEKLGESRIITDYVGSTRVITTEAFSGALHDKLDANPSRYIIFNWKMDGTNWAGKDALAKKDFITNGFNANMLTAIPSQYASDYYIFSRKASITDEQSANLGYIEYGAGLSLTPGAEYNLSFDCAAKQKWYNLVSKGSADASGTSYGDKVPWVQLYSTTVADTQGSIKSVDSYSVSTSAAWTINKTYTNQSASKTTLGNGQGATFNIVTSGDGGTATFHFINRGYGYVVDEELEFLDPAGSGRTATIKVQAINVTGLSLVASENTDSGVWKSGIVGNGATSGYITNYDNNYI